MAAKLTMTVKGVKRSIALLEAEVDKTAVKGLQNTAVGLLQALSAATPVDTGLASESWNIKVGGAKVVIENTVDYIENLNAGSSKQAAPYFIERVALLYGRPIGTIVRVKP